MAEQHYAKITDDMIARIRARIGQPWQPSKDELVFNTFYTQATKDTIRHWANAIGDPNPLYRDPDYAKKTRYGRLVAPPCFLYAIYAAGGRGGQLPGIHYFWAGNEFEWFKPIMDGDEFTYEVAIIDFAEKQSKWGGRIFLPKDECTYKNQRGEVVAKARGWGFLFEREAAKDRTKYQGAQKTQYTPEQLAKIDNDYENEVIRGAEPRYWEDVKVGEQLPQMVKGPHSLVDSYAYIMGFGSRYFRAYGLLRAYQKAHPEAKIYDETLKQHVVPEMAHMSDTLAKQVGMPGAIDYGPARISMMGQLLTNWIGDDGFLWKLHAELRLANVVGDTSWFKGKVTKKYIENGEHCVDVECWVENQKGETTMPGWATAILPSKQEKAGPLQRRLS